MLDGREQAEGRWEHRFWIALRVGPSNAERIALLLHQRAGIDIADARARLAEEKCEFEIGPDRAVAEDIVRAAVEGGARAELVTRGVNVPLWTVTLADAGEKKLAVIAALRAAIDFTVPEAKRLVGAAPCVVVTGVEEADAKKLVAALSALGAKADAQPS